MSYYDDEPDSKWDDVFLAVFVGVWVFLVFGLPIMRYFNFI